MMNRFIPALALLTVAVASMVSGCAGMSTSYPSRRIAPPKHINVVPLTAEFIAQRRRIEQAPASILPETKPEDLVYRIQPGDILDISVPQLAATAVQSTASPLADPGRGYLVYDEGTIALPWIGGGRDASGRSQCVDKDPADSRKCAVIVSGLTPRKARDKVVRALEPNLKQPQIVLSVREFRSQRVMVTGQVPRPGYQPITDLPLTLMGALAAAGAVAELRGGSDPRPVAGSPAGERPAEYPDLARIKLQRGDSDYSIDVAGMLKRGDFRQDVRLKDGDVVLVPPIRRANVFVLGEIARPSLLEIQEQRTNLAEVLLSSGGINPLTAKASRIYVVRGDYDNPTIYQLDGRSPDALLLAQGFEVASNDVVYITEAGAARWNRFLQLILPSLQGLLATAIIVDAADGVSN